MQFCPDRAPWVQNHRPTRCYWLQETPCGTSIFRLDPRKMVCVASGWATMTSASGWTTMTNSGNADRPRVGFGFRSGFALQDHQDRGLMSGTRGHPMRRGKNNQGDEGDTRHVRHTVLLPTRDTPLSHAQRSGSVSRECLAVLERFLQGTRYFRTSCGRLDTASPERSNARSALPSPSVAWAK